MQSTIKKFGLYGWLAGIICFLSSILLTRSLSMSLQEVLGYVAMVASLSFVFFGIKHYRDKENEGVISLGKAIGIGTLISILTGVGVGIADYIYTTLINPDFLTEYLDATLKTMETTLSADEFKIKKAELIAQTEAYGDPMFMAFLMCFTVVLIGFVISLISGLILQRK
ncbi:DUF4199 domain-containing protein [Flavivirga eckloniae]|uniref:DUF4199 domain-containing protein n=1 Tax=Flavivirga eckloniae TaxID=1803846 RepID=A0A2K9PRR4_9FLAO|nr:DUF4199 domain-containing protein [Flavivirga eckloniae]AUP79736.1 DUF4199 domain-containing protein [Flavivirga eckloniae]